MSLLVGLIIAAYAVFFVLLFIMVRELSVGFDGIQDDEIPPDSDWQWLTPEERLGVQTQEDAEIARQIIARRKA